MLKIFFVIILWITLPIYADDDDLNLDFNNTPVSRILETIAVLADKNLVFDQANTASMSLHVGQMNWEEALNLVLTSQRLILRTIGNTWFITSSQNALASAKEQGDLAATTAANATLQTKLIKLHYINGGNLIDLLSRDKALFSPRGQLTWDSRTNTLIVTDTAMNIEQIQYIASRLDVPVPQIHIEARIVVVDKSALQAFGIQLNNGATSAMNLLGAIQGAALNLGIANPAGTIGFGLGTIGGNELDLELQALETSGDGKVISAPELTVSENQTANIQQGSEVPFQTSTSSGATQIEFIPATLGLKVTPTLAENGDINLNLQVNKDSVSSEVGPSGNMPIVNTSQVTTQVLVHQGETIVLGGIYTEERVHTIKGVPILGGIPGIGWLFRNTHDSEKYTDLLVFVTPEIVMQSNS